MAYRSAQQAMGGTQSGMHTRVMRFEKTTIRGRLNRALKSSLDRIGILVTDKSGGLIPTIGRSPVNTVIPPNAIVTPIPLSGEPKLTAAVER